MTKNNTMMHKLKRPQAILSLYFIAVMLIGLSYIIDSKGGNLSTLLAFINGDRDLHVVALIVNSIFEILFEIFALIGSGISIFLILKQKKTKFLPIITLQFSTLIFYLAKLVTLYQGIVHITTEGMIKNTEVWDLNAIASHLFGASKSTFISIFLLMGLIGIGVLAKLHSLEKAKEDVRSRTYGIAE